MKVTYDQEVDIVRIILNDSAIEESDEDKPGIVIDYDNAGEIVGLEILDASERISNPRELEHTVTGARIPSGPWEILRGRIEEFGVREHFDAIRFMFQENWNKSSYKVGFGSFSFWLPEHGKRRSHARLDPENGRVRVIFYRRRQAVKVCADQFKQFAEHVPYLFETLPRGREPFIDPDVIHWEFPITADDWETHKGTLTTLTQAVYNAWEISNSDDESN